MDSREDDFLRWALYFEFNRADCAAPDLAGPVVLAEEERETLRRSLPAFELGGRSDGRRLLRCARRRARRPGWRHYDRAVAGFVEEEGGHAEWLGQFMRAAGIPSRRFDWTDAAFRILRRIGGLETRLSVMLTAEVVAVVYYRALRDATGAPALRTICERLLADEAQHIAFHAAALRQARKQHGPLARWFGRCVQYGLMGLTQCAVWIEHRRVYLSAHYTFRRFAGETLCELDNALLMADGRWDALRIRSGALLPNALAGYSPH